MRCDVFGEGSDDHSGDEAEDGANVGHPSIEILRASLRDEGAGLGERENSDEVGDSQKDDGGADELNLQSGLYPVLCLHLHDMGRKGADQKADDDANSDQQQRVEENGKRLVASDSRREESIGRNDQGSTGGFSERSEKIGRHTSNITNIVTDVIGDSGRVLGTVLRQVLLDLSHQISTHIGCLGVDTATHSTEESHK